MNLVQVQKPIENIPDPFRRRGYAKSYNRWHWENLPKWCYMTDVDSIEFRPGKGIVAIIEIRSTPTFLNKFQYEILREVQKGLNVPVYFVRHEDLKTFDVLRLNDDKRSIMSEGDYKQFIKYL